ncbi:unnamed protein product [Didymodactylos carnosus]|uniref:Tetratricopeptide repeat protein n=1 Tax=Didymodactylos carnosus TaxID=1234261 RepID=A0A8S2KAH7_9BILA|nr:unnamed protein product [Didymodactylos carnosus]CAF3841852.1 unnamed protein product [Didymodactylos carnosus]
MALKFEYELALTYYGKSLTLINETEIQNDKTEIAYLNYSIGRCFYKIDQSNIELLLEYYNKALDFYEICFFENEFENDKIIDIVKTIVSLYTKRKKYELAIDRCQKTLLINKTITSQNKNLISCLNEEIGKLYGIEKNNILACTYLKNALQLKPYETQNDQMQIADLNASIGHYYGENNENDLAIEHSLISLKIWEKQPYSNESKIILFHQNIATYYRRKQDYKLSIDYLEKMLEALMKYGPISDIENDGLKKLIRWRYVNKIYFVSAIDYFTERLMIHENIDQNEIEIANLNNIIGWLYDKVGQFDLALNYCRKSMLIFEKSEKYFEYALVLSNLSVIWYHKNDYDKALQYCEQSISICMRRKCKDIADNFELLGNISQHFNEKTLAYNCYVKALKLFTRFTPEKDMKRINMSLKLINKK